MASLPSRPHTEPVPGTAAPEWRAPSWLVLAWRQGWRDWRAGDLRMLVLAIVLAVAAVCSVAFLSNRLDQGLRRDASQLLGGDVVLTSDQPTPLPIMALAQDEALRTARSASFPSMARAPDERGGETRLVAIKAVQSSYPLKGAVRLSEGSPAGTAPGPGTVWVDPAVLDSLGLKLGESLYLGDMAFQVAAVIADEPDRGGGFINFAPRVMMAWDDLQSTGLIQPASRVSYRLAVAGPEGRSTAGFEQRVRALLEQKGWRGVRLETLENGRPEMRQTLDRATKFLNLVAMLSALMAAVVVVMAARSFAQRHLDACAVLRVLGQTQAQIAGTLTLEFIGVGLVASSLGVALGFVLHFGFLQILAGLVAVELPAPGLAPVVTGLALGLSLLLGFGLAPVLQMASVPPLRVMRRELGPIKAGTGLSLLLGVSGLAGILWGLAGDGVLGLIALLGTSAAVAAFALVAWLLVKLLGRLMASARGPRWLNLATRQMVARPGVVVVQVASLSIGLLALSLLVLLRTELIDSWRQATPANAPDRFVINVQPEQVPEFQRLLQQQGVQDYDLHPMIRGRLLAINGHEIRPQQFAEERAQRLVEREFNLSHMAQAPVHNQIVSGTWNPSDSDGLSVEEGLAKELGLKLGDRLRFDVAGLAVEGTVRNLRKVDWASMRVNFFVVFQRAQMEELPRTYIAAFKVPRGATLDKALARQFPNITVVDVSRQIEQVQGVVNQVIGAVQFLFMFALGVGLLVVVAVVSGSREMRAREYALMRALGASGQLLRQVQRAEMLSIGALAGLLAGLSALTIGALLARQVFEFNWQLRPWVPLLSVMVGSTLALIAGWWSLRGLLSRPVAQTLREAGRE